MRDLEPTLEVDRSAGKPQALPEPEHTAGGEQFDVEHMQEQHVAGTFDHLDGMHAEALTLQVDAC
jgi:hypothetical protein